MIYFFTRIPFSHCFNCQESWLYWRCPEEMFMYYYPFQRNMQGTPSCKYKVWSINVSLPNKHTCCSVPLSLIIVATIPGLILLARIFFQILFCCPPQTQQTSLPLHFKGKRSSLLQGSAYLLQILNSHRASIISSLFLEVLPEKQKMKKIWKGNIYLPRILRLNQTPFGINVSSAWTLLHLWW